jgi:hypothetical protein
VDNQWPDIFGPISNLAFGVFYLVKYYGGFIYFISHAIKNWLKNVATLMRGKPIMNAADTIVGCGAFGPGVMTASTHHLIWSWYCVDPGRNFAIWEISSLCTSLFTWQKRGKIAAWRDLAVSIISYSRIFKLCWWCRIGICIGELLWILNICYYIFTFSFFHLLTIRNT